MPEAVEVQRPDGSRSVGLVVERRTDQASGHRQRRVVVATSRDGEIVEIDTAADRVTPIDGAEADLARDIVGDRLEVSA